MLFYIKVKNIFITFYRKCWLYLDHELFEVNVNNIIDDYQFSLYEHFEHPIKENYFRSMYYNNETYIGNNYCYKIF